MRSELAQLIGVPFAFGGRGPAAFDCYGLVRHLYKLTHDIELPDYDSPSDGARITAIFIDQLRRWEKVDRATGTVALYKIPGNLHCGFVIDEMNMLHAWEKSNGVVIERTADWEKRLMGYYHYVR